MKEEYANSILTAKNLCIGYGTKKNEISIARNINFDIQKGQFVCVVGKNGIGKSTLLRTISGVQKSLSGNVYLNKKTITHYSNSALAKQLSVVLTDHIPESQLSVFEIVALGRQPYTNWIDQLTEQDLTIVENAIKQTDLEFLRNELFYTLSDGQKQRVFIARALAQDTDLIIMDEPTVHLDLHHTIKIFQLLKKIVKTTKKTILISSHQINLCIQLSDAMILFSDKGVESNTTKTLLAQNTFDQLFPKKLVVFNKDLQQFIISKDQTKND